MSTRPQKKERASQEARGRSLPGNEEAEIGVICSIMLHPPEVLRMCEDRGLTAEWFLHPVRAELYEAMLAIHTARVPVDVVTVTEHLRDVGRLVECGGADAIFAAFGFLPTAANASYYLDLLAAKYATRELIRLTQSFCARAYEELDTVGELIDEFQGAAIALNRPDATGLDTVRQVKPAVIEAVAAIEEIYHHRGGVVGLPTGFHQIDRMTGGMRGPMLIVPAGRPSMGKSAFVWGIADHLAFECGKKCLGFSLEMNAVELVTRSVCKYAGVNLQRVRDGFLSQIQMTSTLPRAAQKVASGQLWIDETPAISIQELRVKVRRFIRKHPDTCAVFIDYLQLMRSTSKRAQENRALEIGEISGGLKGLAKEINRPILACAQLNRDNDGPNNKPKLSNLRESGSIEQDADWVFLIHRKHYYTKADEDKGKANIDLAKQRNGPTGDVAVEFDHELGCFKNPPGQDMYSNNPEHRQRAMEEQGG